MNIVKQAIIIKIHIVYISRMINEVIRLSMLSMFKLFWFPTLQHFVIIVCPDCPHLSEISSIPY